jgi:hypothetical protein
MVDGRQHILMTSGLTFIAFALPVESAKLKVQSGK